MIIMNWQSVIKMANRMDRRYLLQSDCQFEEIHSEQNLWNIEVLKADRQIEY